jgi:hypothetical protein
MRPDELEFQKQLGRLQMLPESEKVKIRERIYKDIRIKQKTANSSKEKK